MNTTRKIGNILIDRGILTSSGLEEALFLQKRWGSKLGEVLVGLGKVNPYTLYQALAEQDNRPFVDLRTQPCDSSLLNASLLLEYLAHRALPWCKKGEVIVFAAVTWNEEVAAWAKHHYGNNVEVVLCTPQDIHETIRQHFSAQLTEYAVEHLSYQAPQYSAKRLDFTRILIIPAIITSLFIAALSWQWPTATLLTLTTLFTLFCALCMVFKLWLIGAVWFRPKTYPITLAIPENELPIYTLLIPLYREKESLPQLINAIRALDYPKSKLDVKIILEEDDRETIEGVKQLRCERYFEMIIVPPSFPRTKPKACNYGLMFARGKYVTIFDAEDIPEPDQLKKAAALFAQSEKTGMDLCLQARLNYYNRYDNILAGLFAIEYGLWFNWMLVGLLRCGMPVPLGGTSNHFSAKSLQKLYAWDAYNVTEDADIGLRFAEHGGNMEMLDSTTWESAVDDVWGWIRQRSRWIKGYIQTYLSHLYHRPKLREHYGWKGVLCLHMFIGAPVILFLLSPLFWMIVIWGMSGWYGLDTPPAIAPELIHLGWIAFGGAYCLHTVLAGLVVVKTRWWHLLYLVPIFPLYTILHCIAGYRALWQLFTKPFFWDKTTHNSRVEQDSKEIV